MINTLKWWILSLKVAHESVISSRRHNLDRIVWLDDTSLPPWISFVPCAQLPAYHAASHYFHPIITPQNTNTQIQIQMTNTQIQSSGPNYQLITRHHTITTPIITPALFALCVITLKQQEMSDYSSKTHKILSRCVHY